MLRSTKYTCFFQPWSPSYTGTASLMCWEANLQRWLLISHLWLLEERWHLTGILKESFLTTLHSIIPLVKQMYVGPFPGTETCWCGITCAHTITPSRVAVPGCLWWAVLGHSSFANCAWELFGKVLAGPGQNCTWTVLTGLRTAPWHLTFSGIDVAYLFSLSISW